MSAENNMSNTEELTDEQFWLILFSLATDFPENEWNEFSHDLIYKDRFSSSHKVVEAIQFYAERCTTTIKKGLALYRARIYHRDPLRDFLSDVFKDKKYFENTRDINEYYFFQIASLLKAVEKKSEKGKEIVDSYRKWQQRRFKGYNALDSGAPPVDIGSAGRINPERIRYLYLAEDPETAIYEVRPTIGQNVSVATFKTKEDLKIYDLAVENKKTEEVDHKYDLLFSVIQQKFSEPNTGDKTRYISTQYLGEMIKHMGFDGIRYKSSLRSGGVNVVLFDDEKCKALRSDLIIVGDIELKFVNPEIYQLEDYLIFDEDSDT